MPIMAPGVFPDTAFPDRFWIDDAWADFGLPKIVRGLASVIDPKNSTCAIIDPLKSATTISVTLNSEVNLQ